MRLNHNMISLGCYNTYKKTLKSNATAMERINTGMKINSAKDSPNKIGQSEQMRIQLKSMQSAQRSVQDASSMLQTADGALQEANSILARMKEIAVQASSQTNQTVDAQAMQNEFNELSKNLTELTENTEFNGVKLIGNENVANNKYPVHTRTVIGGMVGEVSAIPMYNISPEALKTDDGVKLSDVDFVTSPDTASASLQVIDAAITTVSTIRTRYGAMSNRFESTYDNLDESSYNLTRAESNIRDADIAEEILEVSRTQLLTNASLGLIAQTNNIPMDALRTLERTR